MDMDFVWGTQTVVCFCPKPTVCYTLPKILDDKLDSKKIAYYSNKTFEWKIIYGLWLNYFP